MILNGKYKGRYGQKGQPHFIALMEEATPKLLTAHLPSKTSWTNMYSINIKLTCDPQF